MLEIYNNKDLNKDNRLFNSEPINYSLGWNSQGILGLNNHLRYVNLGRVC